MEKLSVNDLVIKLMEDHNLDYEGLADKIGCHPTTTLRIVNKESVPNKSTLKLIASAMGIEDSYWRTGVIKKAQQTDVWKDETYKNLREEIAYLREIVKLLAGGKMPEGANFLKALNQQTAGKVIQMRIPARVA